MKKKFNCAAPIRGIYREYSPNLKLDQIWIGGGEGGWLHVIALWVNEQLLTSRSIFFKIGISLDIITSLYLIKYQKIYGQDFKKLFKLKWLVSC